MTARRLRLAQGMTAVVLAVACGPEEGPHPPHHEDEQGHHHHHGPVVSITRWSDTLELFAEHPPAVRGEPLSFLAHVTLLDGWRALDPGRVRLTLTGPAEVSAEAGMERPGIYQPTVTPPAAGDYHGRLEILEGGEGAVEFDVTVYPDEAAADEAVGEEEEEGSEIALLKEQQWRVAFATAPAQRGSLAPGVETSGEIGTPPAGRAHVHAPISGRVLAGRDGFPVPGQAVEAGAELVRLAPTPASPEDAARASAAVVEAEVELEAASAALARAERMLADGATPERTVDDARRRVRAADASLQSARRLQALFASATSGGGRGTWRVSSPIDGVVDAVGVSPGEAVEAHELLLRVVDSRERWLTAFVPEAWAARVHPDAEGVSFRLVGEERWRALRGALVHVSAAVDERSRTVSVIWSISEPPPELRVGAAVRVSIPSGEPEEGVVVPAGAVVDVEGRPVIYVQLGGEAFEERAVRLGASDGARVLLREGVEAGERVVTQGGYLVRLAGTANETGGHAHGHPH